MTVFLTALTPSEKVKGSRDPLGLLPVWSRLGRTIIKNVTTVSGDLRGWTTLMLSVGITQALMEESVLQPGEHEECFFRAEQLIAYSRELYGNGSEVRGVSRVRTLLRESAGGTNPIPLGTRHGQHILSRQRSTGVWGQIGRSAEVSGLVDRARMRLQPPAVAMWLSTWFPALAPHWRALRAILRGQRGFAPGPGGQDEALARVLTSLHAVKLHSDEIPRLRDHILHGNQTDETPQRQLVTTWQAAGTGSSPDTAMVLSLAQSSENRGYGVLGAHLRDIVAAEQLLGPMEVLFGWLLGQHEAERVKLATELEGAWGSVPAAAQATDSILAAPAESAYPGIGMPKQLHTIRDALVGGQWSEVITGLISLNRLIMAARGGAAWIEVRDGRLDVRLGGDSSIGLSALTNVQNRLVHGYYLDTFRRLIHAWEVGCER